MISSFGVVLVISWFCGVLRGKEEEEERRDQKRKVRAYMCGFPFSDLPSNEMTPKKKEKMVLFVRRNETKEDKERKECGSFFFFLSGRPLPSCDKKTL